MDYELSEPRIKPGLAYLWDQQEDDGAWFGRWVVNYIYGTAAALTSLGAWGFKGTDPRVAKAVDWLYRHQNEDGGWGKSCLSYTDRAWRGRRPSTASQTTWAILGLLTAQGFGDPALQGGLRRLLEHQDPEGTWDEPYFTGTGFPEDFYLKYHKYRNYFPALALARAWKAQSAG